MIVIVAMALFSVFVVVMLVFVVVAMTLFSMLVVMLVVMAMAFLTVLVMVLVVVVVAMAFLTVLVMVLVVVAMTLITMFMVMMFVIVVMTMALFSMVGVMRLCFELVKLVLKRVRIFYRCENSFAVKLIPGSGYNNCLGVLFAKQRKSSRKLFIAYSAGAAENYGIGILYLVVVKLTEVFHIYFALRCIGNGYLGVEDDVACADALYSFNYVRELSHSGGLYKYSVGGKFGNYFAKSLVKVSHKAATDTTAVHFGNFYSCFFQESAVYSYFSEFVFYKDNFFI